MCPPQFAMVSGAAPSASASVNTPASQSTVARHRLNGLDLQADAQPATSKKKKTGARVPDKNDRGLRLYTIRVSEKVERKGRTTYKEVVDELVAEFSDNNINIDSLDPDNPYPNTATICRKERIWRRVNNALNVLMALGVISKDKKKIQWRGLPNTRTNDIEELKTKAAGLKAGIDKKIALLQNLQDRYVSLQNTIQQNQQQYGSGDPPSSGVALPLFILKPHPHTAVVAEISEDMQTVHFDFNSTPFELDDGSSTVKAIGLSGKEETDGTQAPVANC